MRVTLELRGLPRFRVMDDLEQVGGRATELPRDLLVIEGADPAVERVAAFMRHRVTEMQHGR